MIQRIVSACVLKSRGLNISFPIVAYNSFQRLKGSRTFRKIVEYVSRKLQKISDPIARARFVHKQVKKYNDEILKDPIVSKHISCKIGCTACCHSQVSATEEEASLLALRIKNGVVVDFTKLQKQKSVGNSVADWYRLDYEDRGCVFLDENNACSVYEDRPSVCRTNYVISDPIQCETRDGVEKPIRLLNTLKSNMVIYAAYKETKQAGIMPNLLWTKLEEEKASAVTIIKKNLSNELL